MCVCTEVWREREPQTNAGPQWGHDGVGGGRTGKTRMSAILSLAAEADVCG